MRKNIHNKLSKNDKLEDTQQEYIEIKAVEENGKCPVCNT
jgi:hypothetical protein